MNEGNARVAAAIGEDAQDVAEDRYRAWYSYRPEVRHP